MAIAWYFSMSLVKQYDLTIKYFEVTIMDKCVHNKALQKAAESLQITPEQKSFFKGLKIKTGTNSNI